MAYPFVPSASLCTRPVQTLDCGRTCLLRFGSWFPSDAYFRISTDTLIVWTEPDGADYALSFQDPEGCLEVWNFIQEVQRHMITSGR